MYYRCCCFFYVSVLFDKYCYISATAILNTFFSDQLSRDCRISICLRWVSLFYKSFNKQFALPTLRLNYMNRCVDIFTLFQYKNICFRIDERPISLPHTPHKKSWMSNQINTSLPKRSMKTKNKIFGRMYGLHW